MQRTLEEKKDDIKKILRNRHTSAEAKVYLLFESLPFAFEDFEQKLRFFNESISKNQIQDDSDVFYLKIDRQNGVFNETLLKTQNISD